MTTLPSPASPFAARQRGFMLAMLLAAMTVMGIFLTMARPTARAEVQREMESELIFRGEAIAQALKLYKAKFQHYPNNLEEVMKVKPRLLRQLYKDPMTPSGEWDYIYQVQPGASGDTRGLPIVGVRSKSSADTFHAYQEKTLASDWTFSAEENAFVTGGTGALGGGGKSGGSGAPPAGGKK